MRGKRNLFRPGDRFGKLVILKVWTEMRYRKATATRASYETIAEVRCDCGTVLTTKTRYFAKGHKRSCGCLRNPFNNQHPSWKGHGEISSTYWLGVKLGASSTRSRVIDFIITIEEAWDLFLRQDRKCALSGLQIEFAKRHPARGHPTHTASLDRIDSKKGYTLDNVQWVHKDVNKMKFDLGQDRFLELCQKIAKWAKKHNR